MNYLDEIVLQVQTRPIPWEGYIRGESIIEEDAHHFMKAETPGKQREELVEASASKVAKAVTRVLGSCAQDDIVRFVLLFASDVLSVSVFADDLAKSDEFWTNVTKLLERHDEQIPPLAANLMTQLLSKHAVKTDSVSKLFEYLTGIISGDASPKLDLALQWLSQLLQVKEYRPQFQEYQDKAVSAIDAIVKPPSKGGLQAQYYGLLSLWLLSFDKDLAIKLSTNYGTVDTVLQAAKTAVKEKITRVAVAILVNLVNFAPTAASVLIGQHGLPVIRSLADRKWTDEELREDVVTLRDELVKTFDSMSTFDVYLSELNSKHLQWSPPHRSEAFWKTNITEFAANDYKVLRKLLKLLINTTIPLNQAIACNDVANIINENPASTSIVNEENAKTHIMGLMESSDPEVRYEALKATQAFISKLLK